MKNRQAAPARGRSERGSSLIEVLVALLIMLFLMIGVLQLFSMAYLVNLGASARTDMTYKCQQVIENIRYVQFLRAQGTSLPGTGIPMPLSVTSTPITLPTSTSDTTFAFWGPNGADVLGRYNGTVYTPPPYVLSYTIQNGNGMVPPVTNMWVITVTAVPNLTSSAPRSLGAGISRKRVDYVAQIPQ